MMHYFITNENNFQNYNEYTYKARRKKLYRELEEASEINTQHIGREET